MEELPSGELVLTSARLRFGSDVQNPTSYDAVVEFSVIQGTATVSGPAFPGVRSRLSGGKRPKHRQHLNFNLKFYFENVFLYLFCIDIYLFILLYM